MGFSTFSRQHSRVDSAASVFGLSRIGFVFLLSVIDTSTSGSLLSLRSFARFGPASFTLDYSNVESLMLLHSYVRVGLALLCWGLSRIGFVFALSVLDATQLGSLLSVRCFTCLDSFAFTLNFAHVDFPSFVRNHLQPALPMFVFGIVRVNSSVSIFDFGITDFSLSLHSPAQLDSPLLALDFAKLDFPFLLRQFTHLEPAASIFGLSRAGFVFSLFLVDAATFSSLLSIQSLTCMGFAAPAMDFLRLDFSISIRSSGRVGSAVSAFDFLRLDFALFLRSYSRLDPSAFIPGLTRFDFLPSVFDAMTLGFTLSLQSHAYLGPSSPALDVAHMGLLTLVRNPVCFDFFVSVFGCSRPGSVFSLPVMDTVTIGSSFSPHSFARFGSFVLTLDFVKIDSSLLLRQFAYAEPTVFLFGLSRPDLVFALSVVDVAIVELLLSLQSLAYMDLALPLLDYGHINSSMSARKFQRVDPAILVFGMSRPALSPSVFELVHYELSMLLKSFARSESLLLVLDSAYFDLSTLAQDFTRLESAVLISGLSCAGPVFALPIVDSATMGFTPFIRSFTCSDLSPFVLDASRLGLLIFPKDFA